jgi:tetratricopeptide (TPR) repeat protein
VKTPENNTYSNLLLGLCSRLGNLYVNLDQPARALEPYQQGIAIGEDLHRRAPDSAEYAHNLTIIYNSLGDLYMTLGEASLAINAYQQSLPILEELQRRAPENAGYAGNLAVLYSRLFIYLKKEGKSQQADEIGQRGLKLVRAMQAAKLPFNADQAKMQRERKAIRDALASGGSLTFTPHPSGEANAAVPLDIEDHEPSLASTPHQGANANVAMRLNIEYQKARRVWESLPRWKRWRTKKPEPPTGI